MQKPLFLKSKNEFQSTYAAWGGNEHFKSAEWHTHRDDDWRREKERGGEEEKKRKRMLDKAMGFQERYIRRVQKKILRVSSWRS